MRLEEAIRQKKFRSEKQKAFLNLYYTHSRIRRRVEDLLKEKLTLRQFNVLRILRGQRGKPLCMKEIKSRMLDKSPDVSRIIERLRTRGMVSRHICPGNRRQMEVQITRKGLSLLSSLSGVDTAAEKILASLTVKEARLLNELLDKARG